MQETPPKLAECPIVLVVEDDEGQARLTQRALKTLGLACRIEGTGAGCMRAVGEEHDCVVLLDLGLPDVAEFELLSELVQSDRQIPLIVVTGNDDLTVAIEALRRGAWDYVVKRPNLSHLNELSYVIERNLERRNLMQERNLFRSMLSHDIRNPLNIIYNYADILAEDGFEADSGRELLERIKDNALTTLDLVSNFVEMDRIESGRLIFEREQVEVPELIQRVLRRHRPMADAKGVALNMDYDGEEITTFADRAYLERVVTNLVSNAIKFTSTGGRVWVRIVAVPEEVRISFEDTGCGVPANECKSIFEKYRRASSTRSVDGTGLGLYIVRSVIQAHGGTIEIESTPGVGSTFHVALPTMVAEPGDRKIA
jgi:signal transduction histidine kinase